MDLEVARAALRRGDAAAAREAVEGDVDDPAVAEVLARADYLEHRYPEAVAGWERAYAGYRSAGDAIGAIRSARTLSGVYLTVYGELAVSRGWLARAQTLLEGHADPAERGWVELNQAMFEPDRTVKNARFREALTQARVAGDTALELSTLGYLGASLVHAGEVDEGMALLDEALAALAGDEVDDFFVVEEVFCQLFSACEHVRDVNRADQWIRVGEVIAERRRLPAVSAFCRTHYGGVLTAAGRWEEADRTLTEAVRLWDLQRKSMLRAGALVRLAELRLRQGRVDEAAALLEDVGPEVAGETAPVRAAVHLARGEVALAREALDGALADIPDGIHAVGLRTLLVEVLLAEGDVAGAEAACERLAAVAEHDTGEYVRAAAALAQGRLCLARGTGDPASCLREALARFARAGMPLEVARTRYELAAALAETRPEAARAEARAALEALEALEAARLADAAAELLRQLGVRPSTARAAGGVLTKREQEVLELLGHGLSNPEIAERLFISRKTVEHHVSNLLAKLGLRSRGEAAAYAVRQGVREPAAD